MSEVSRLAVAAARFDRFSVVERERIAAEVTGAGPAAAGALLVHTCHRVEIVGFDDALAVAVGALSRDDAGRLEWARGEATVRHVLRLAAGLESAVRGEDQVLAQVRAALLSASPLVPAAVRRLLELALSVGRRARSGRTVPRDLSGHVLEWLASQGVRLDGGRLLVVGAGTMGERIGAAATSRGARVTVAARTADRAREAAARFGGSGIDLGEAARIAPSTSGIAVALRGPWEAIVPDDSLPPLVDLSAPPAVSSEVRAVLGTRFADIDRLAVRSEHPDADEGAYTARADRLVAAAMDEYLRWIGARSAVATIRALREGADARREQELDRLLRRLPDLDERERELITAFSRQLTGALLHEPTARLRGDADGTLAPLARVLFDLPS